MFWPSLSGRSCKKINTVCSSDGREMEEFTWLGKKQEPDIKCLMLSDIGVNNGHLFSSHSIEMAQRLVHQFGRFFNYDSLSAY